MMDREVITLAGGGRTLTVPGKNVKVDVALSLARKDLSGQSSDSSFANAGAKPQTVNVSCQIPIANRSQLTDLAEVARACDAKDEPIVYSVSNALCDAMNLRMVVFSGEFRVQESDDLRVFDVSFQLQEFKSVSEKREERANGNAAQTAPVQDGEVQVGSTNAAKITEIVKETKR